MVNNMSREELNGMIYDVIQDNHQKVEELTGQCFSIPSNTLEFLEQSIELSAYLSMNMWLTQNSDCASVDDLNYRIYKYQCIIQDKRFQEIDKNMEVAAFANLYLKNMISFRKKFISLLNEQELSLGNDPLEVEKKYFGKAISLIDSFLNDDKILEAEKLCHFKLYGIAHKEEWGAVDYYKINEINKLCLKKLKDFLFQLEQESFSIKNK